MDLFRKPIFRRRRIAALLLFLSGSPAIRAEVVINEIMFHPPGEPGLPEPLGCEFLELYNTGGSSISLAGWEIDAGVTFVFPEVVVAPGGFLVVAADTEEFAAKYPLVTAKVIGPWTGRLSNSGERIRLRNNLGEEVDELTYADEGDWAVRRRGPLDRGHRGWVWESSADGGGGSLELVNPWLSNRRGQNWTPTVSGGETPGSANGAYSEDPAPFILGVRHSPVIPGENDRVVITADLRDLPGQSLNAVVSFGTESNSELGRTELVMSDDGLHGDGDAGDGTFGAILPAFPDGTVVDFYVIASDGFRTRTWPGPTDEAGTQGANALFQVESTPFESDQELPVYRLVLSPGEEAEFDFSSFNSNSNARMNATFIARNGNETDVRYLSGIRRRGAGSRRRNPRTCRLNLPSDQPWQGMSEMNLNSQFNYLQVFGQKLFAASGLPSANGRSIEFVINGEDQSNESERLLGAYAHLEPQGSESVERQFPDDPNGNLYSKRRPDNQLAFRDGDVEAYLEDGWSKGTNSSDADWSDLDNWLAALADIANPNYLENLEEIMDVDQWLRWFGVMALIANGETNISNGADDDYYVYAGLIDRRMKAIPHDLDTILARGDGSAITNPRHTIYDFVERGDSLDVLEPFIDHPDVLRRYHRALRDLIAGPFSKPRFDSMVHQLLSRRVPASVRQEMIAFMDARRAYVLEVVNPDLTVTSNLPVEGGFPRTLNPEASLSGVVNLTEASRVTVNGEEALVDEVNGTWSFGDQVVDQVSFIAPGASWKYLDDGSDQGTAWQEAGFDDSGWKEGNGELGYGDSDEATEILYGPNNSNLINFFTSRNNRFITTYFRRVVTIDDPAEFEEFVLRVKRDDGVAIYVNGTLQAIDNLPADPAFNTVANDAIGEPEEENFIEFRLPPGAFHAGSNTIAVEVHLAAPDDSDLSFDLSLAGLKDPLSGGEERGLLPGLNVMVVEAWNGHDEVVETRSLEIWYDDGDTVALGGGITEDTTLVAADGPYVVSGDLTVRSGATLFIEPGTTVFFSQGARMIIEGRLLAEGAAYRRIQFSVIPGSGNTWGGLVFDGSDADSRMTFVDQSFATSSNQSIDVRGSRVTLQQMRWRGTTETILEVRNPKMNIVECEFPSSDGNEVIHGTALEGEEFFNLIGNTFQTSSGYNDIIDFSGGRRPGPIIYIIDNTFQGGTDDCLDLDGIDAHIEGNTFLNIHTDDPDRPSTSNAIATDGDAHITVVRNIFDDVDHALLLKNESDAVFENNVVRRATLGAINFREPLRADVDAGSDVFCRGNIFVDNAVTFRFPDHPREGGGLPNIVAERNILPVEDHQYGTENLDLDPAFVDPDGLDFSLLPDSPARGSGIIGMDMGAAIPRGAGISGEPEPVTVETGATIFVHIAGISGLESGSFRSEYRWRLNDGPWSADTEISVPINLSGLIPGDYQVEVVAKDSNGIWQETPTVSRPWRVVTDIPPAVRINELVADNGSGPDWVELHNPGSSSLSLSGLVIADRPTGVPGTLFPPGTVIPPGGYFQVSLGVDFALDREGDALYLLSGLTVLDSVVFGHQVRGYSLARLGSSGEWGLGLPSPSAPNQAAGTGDPRRLKINEWTANAGVVIGRDFVELYNPGRSPVSLGGLFLTENPGGDIEQLEIPPLTFINSGGHVALDFSMSARSRNVALFAPGGELIDLAAFTSQVEDTSFARLPDGSEHFGVSQLPTPGGPNGSTEGIVTVTRSPLGELGDVWKYDESGQDLGTLWREDGFDDSLWPQGPGLLGFEDDSIPGPGIMTELNDPASNDPYIPTYYFRREFEFNGDPAGTDLFLEAVIDDGVVVYLNGEPLYRQGIDENPSYETFASASGEASLDGPFGVPAAALRQGTNILAAEVHQTNARSSDIVFGLALEAEETVFMPIGDEDYFKALDLVRDLRITELMFDPAEGTDFEFVELCNIGGGNLELEGVRFVDGIQFLFPEWSLSPGESVLIVKDRAAFERKYGTGYPVAGEYEGKLSNGGEKLALRLPAPYTATILEFTYNDSWYPVADGGGASLQIVDPLAPAREWNNRFSWRSGALNGTPGSQSSLRAGEHQTTFVSQGAILNGFFAGDAVPFVFWEQVEGPAASIFSDSGSLSPSVTFVLPGTYRFRLSALEGASVLTAETIVTVDDTYPDWATRFGVSSGISGDDDEDGIINFMEYALDQNPGMPDLPAASFLQGGSFLYTRHLRKADLLYRVDTSPDLTEWQPGADQMMTTTPDTQVRRYRLREGGWEFVRLRVTR